VLSGALHIDGVVQQVKDLPQLLLAGTRPVDWIDHGSEVKRKVSTRVIEQNRNMAVHHQLWSSEKEVREVLSVPREVERFRTDIQQKACPDKTTQEACVSSNAR
jgi:hypothetical protein